MGRGWGQTRFSGCHPQIQVACIFFGSFIPKYQLSEEIFKNIHIWRFANQNYNFNNFGHKIVIKSNKIIHIKKYHFVEL